MFSYPDIGDLLKAQRRHGQNLAKLSWPEKIEIVKKLRECSRLQSSGRKGKAKVKALKFTKK